MKIRQRQGIALIAIVSGLLVLVSFFESLRYFAPLAFKTTNATTEQALPDGSAVVLNTHSTLSLSSEWKKDADREAWLEGEGFFTVRSITDTNGFTIHTSRFDVVALQAKLNVLDRKDTVQAWLQDGAAYILSHDSKPRKISFAPGDMVEWNNHQIIVSRKEDNGITAWKTKK